MQTELETRPNRTPVLRRVGAGLVLVIVAALALKLAIGFILGIFWVIIAAAAVIAVLWACKTLFW